MPIKILIAEDERNLRKVLVQELSFEGTDVDEVDDGKKALDLLQKDEYDVLLLDLNMPVLGGLEVLQKIRHLEIPTEVIILTADMTLATAVEAMKLGAYDYLTKPFNFSELSLVIEKACEKKKLRRENLLLKTQIRRQSEGNQIIVKSPVMLELLEMVRKIALSDFPVLISGESGSGKELFARKIHDDSARANGPFLAINCGALPENMIESELFGYEKGAFTGAHARKPGLLEIAHDGTLFLDEIGDMPLVLQVKLLRVIETGSFFRLGGTMELKVNLRIVAATNKDLKAAIEKSTFRQDLFFRIAALTVQIPPLRERPEDIPPLIEHFTRSAPGFRAKQFSGEALKILMGYPWPGNARELQHVVHRALLLSQGEVIGPSDLPSDLVRDGGTAGSSRLEDIERAHIMKVVKEAGGQRGKAAEVLGIDPKTLYRKLSSYGIET
jgi:DNA-binding NtrC family response regulator